MPGSARQGFLQRGAVLLCAVVQREAKQSKVFLALQCEPRPTRAGQCNPLHGFSELGWAYLSGAWRGPAKHSKVSMLG